MTAPAGPILVTPGRAYRAEQTLAVWAVMLGTVYALNGPRSQSMAAMADGWALPFFAAGLIAGGLLTVLGSFWLSNLERALEIERAGQVALTGALLVYVAAAFSHFGWAALLPGGLAAAWMWSNIGRVADITRCLRHLRKKGT